MTILETSKRARQEQRNVLLLRTWVKYIYDLSLTGIQLVEKRYRQIWAVTVKFINPLDA